MKIKLCDECGNRIGNGERHAQGKCPPRAKPGNNRRARKIRDRRRVVRVGMEAPERGAPIPGTGKPGGE